ncbi:MAG: anti-sigma factor [Rhodothermia bacterium]|nr:anti-sigma factor [Rhodothermia bacterium]NNE35089.1 anti-sigma factor [Rhodothermales bacterium]
MTDTDFFELANRVIDGAESDDDRTALNTVIGQSMSRRLEFEQLTAVASILDAVRPVEPPEGLRNRILAAIPRDPSRQAAASRVSIWQQISEFTVGKPVYALAYAAVVGLLVGALGLVAVIGPETAGDASGTYGTMAPIGGAFSVADQTQIDMNDVSASAVLLLRESEFVIEVDVDTDDQFEVVVSPISEVTTWYGVELGGGAKLTGAQLDPDELRFPVVGASAVRVSGLRADLGVVQCIVSIVDGDRVVGEMMLAESDLRAE